MTAYSARLTWPEMEARRASKKESEKESRRTYNASPAMKAARAAYKKTDASKAQAKAYRERPEVRQFQRLRNASPAMKAARAAYKKTETSKAQAKAYSERPEVREKAKAYQARPEGKVYRVKARLKKNYGITIIERDALLITQGGVCQICAKGIAFGGQSSISAVVDHDHDLGHVRGILCTGCNKALGLLNDSPEALLGALRYLDAAGIRPVTPAA